MDKPHDEMALYRAWGELDSGASAQLRRVTEPEELLDVPAFYRLAQPHGWLETGNRNALLRQVFCLSAGKDTIKHTDKKVSLGEALARVNRINKRHGAAAPTVGPCRTHFELAVVGETAPFLEQVFSAATAGRLCLGNFSE
jgi:CRISPR system Cascade subunit CasB